MVFATHPKFGILSVALWSCAARQAFFEHTMIRGRVFSLLPFRKKCLLCRNTLFQFAPSHMRKRQPAFSEITDLTAKSCAGQRGFRFPAAVMPSAYEIAMYQTSVPYYKPQACPPSVYSVRPTAVPLWRCTAVYNPRENADSVRKEIP